jgi:hypothetical protein
MAPGTGAEAAQQRVRTVRDLALSAATTQAQVAKMWGASAPYGPSGAIAAYDINPDEMLWLSFSDHAPHNLERALLVKGGFVSSATVLFNELAVTKSRRCDQIDFNAAVTARQVNAVWGPPDGFAGSGIVRWTYTLANGSTASVVFSGEKVVAVEGCQR